jgi:hypothetical protein
MKKWIIRLFLVGMLLVVGLLVTGYLLRDWVARKGIEKGGSDALGVTVTCAKVESHPFSGSVKIDGTVVGNPPGFKSPNLLSLGSLTVKEVVVDGPSITIESSGLKTNVGALLDNIEKSSGKEKEQKGVAKKKFKIDSLKIRNAKVKFIFEGISTEQSIPELDMKDIGTDSNGGTSTAKLIGVIVYALAESAVGGARGVSKELLGSLNNDLAGAAGSITNQASKSFESLKNTTKGITDSIGDIFKKK